MPTLLHIDSSSRGSHSVSRALTAAIAEAWRERFPEGDILRRDLVADPLPYIDGDWADGAFSFAPLTPAQGAALALSDQLIDELKRADLYLIGAPMYNFGIPAALKAYLDQITRVGQTVALSPDGHSTGLLVGKRAIIVHACGGHYGEGTSLAACNFVEPYLRTLLGFLGVTEVIFLNAEGAAEITFGRVTLDAYLAPLLPKARALPLQPDSPNSI